jgi:nucleoside phosphorylase
MVSCFIFTALFCEAKPFIEKFNLKKEQVQHPFAIYSGNKRVLVVTGIGKVAMATAVGYALAKFEASEHPVLMNIGIAGHPTASLGQLWGANKIIEVETGQCYYPQSIIKSDHLKATIYTVSTPNNHYPKKGLYEMEASGFYESARHFSTAELILVFKVISDNSHERIASINAKKVTEWIALSVERVAQHLQSLQEKTLELTVLEQRDALELHARFYFNINNRRQLQKQLQRWHVLTEGAALDFHAHTFQSAKAVLAWLQTQINQQPYRL